MLLVATVIKDVFQHINQFQVRNLGVQFFPHFPAHGIAGKFAVLDTAPRRAIKVVVVVFVPKLLQQEPALVFEQAKGNSAHKKRSGEKGKVV
jgi:hypothetical protein